MGHKKKKETFWKYSIISHLIDENTLVSSSQYNNMI